MFYYKLGQNKAVIRSQGEPALIHITKYNLNDVTKKEYFSDLLSKYQISKPCRVKKIVREEFNKELVKGSKLLV